MKNIFFSLTFSILFMSIPNAVSSQKNEIKNVVWKVAAQLHNDDDSISIGFAGPINGLSNNALMVCGGANFPDKMPWEGGKKQYSDKIHILQKINDEYVWNKNIQTRLPEPIAYCGITSTPLGTLYVGGENEKGLSKKTYLLNFSVEKNKVDVKSLPDFPIAITNIALTNIDNVIYAIGGDQMQNSSSLFFSLDLNKTQPKWKELPKLPVALANAVSVVQKGKDGLNIYVVGGRTKTVSGISDLHNNTFAFNLKKQAWKQCAVISEGENTTNFSAGAGVPVGEHSILILGGDNGIIFHKIETYLSQISQAKTPEEKNRLIAEKNILNTTHKGFYRGMLLYNTLTDKWIKCSELPFPAQVTTTAVIWGKDIILSNGEIKPGIRTPNLMLGKIEK